MGDVSGTDPQALTVEIKARTPKQVIDYWSDKWHDTWRELMQARAELHAARQALAAIGELHKPKDVHVYPTKYPSDANSTWSAWRPGADDEYVVEQKCVTCDCGRDDWPCETYRLVSGVLGEAQQDRSSNDG